MTLDVDVNIALLIRSNLQSYFLLVVKTFT